MRKSACTWVHNILIKLKIWNAVKEGEGIFAKSNQLISNLISCDITFYMLQLKLLHITHYMYTLYYILQYNITYYVSELISLHIMYQEKKCIANKRLCI